ncbi:MAG TPA: hypothetical protein VEC06_10615 [Paucimonas sp.]|nr:hypothetical protein [Paucimonas sp.]
MRSGNGVDARFLRCKSKSLVPFLLPVIGAASSSSSRKMLFHEHAERVIDVHAERAAPDISRSAIEAERLSVGQHIFWKKPYSSPNLIWMTNGLNEVLFQSH